MTQKITITSAQQADTGDAYFSRISLHVDAICELSEAWISTPLAEQDGAIPDAIARHEGALQKLGLNQADIYSFVNRASVPVLWP